MQIYISCDGAQRTGPFSVDEVRAQLTSGKIKPTDLAWYQGIADWQPISSIPQVMANLPRLSIQPVQPSAYSHQSVAAAPPVIADTAPLKANKTKTIITMLVSGLFGLICFIITLFVVINGMERKHTAMVPLIMGIFGTISGFCFAVQMIAALRGPGNGVCEGCNQRASTINVTLNRHIGAILLMFHKSRSGAFCKNCIGQTFWEYTVITAALGWWGMMSFFITPVVLTNNLIAYVRSFFISKVR